MLNLLIVDDNFHFSKNLINLLVDSNPNIRICGIATNGKETLNFLKDNNNKIDIILLDLKLPYFNGFVILDEISKKNITHLKNSIIVISCASDLLLKTQNNPYLYDFIDKSRGLHVILESINNLSKEKEFNKISIEEKIYKELEYLHFEKNFLGTKYLYEVILFLAKNPHMIFEKFEKSIYPLIAKRHNTSPHNIKCNIYHATDIMNCMCKREIIMSYFNFNYFEKVITPKQLVHEILNKIGIHN